ncbi:uncharacterized protein LOC120698555 isoform X2 [Panicum virgatum]|uniref:uncharacterized protein LOC120698555 isoform X2 n=1 Tax=Panicum virgatum TaxID=38727 RepID=UPI0019D52FC2|nr:uncharacterized protein LOC120698555 isoform X2 [Panicum virgatum]XP_039838169.1 uncharacterized protein LOC120698555 isoform X2 [Panicum virgatum]
MVPSSLVPRAMELLPQEDIVLQGGCAGIISFLLSRALFLAVWVTEKKTGAQPSELRPSEVEVTSTLMATLIQLFRKDEDCTKG